VLITGDAIHILRRPENAARDDAQGRNDDQRKEESKAPGKSLEK
jgi:hypothetical protein